MSECVRNKMVRPSRGFSRAYTKAIRESNVNTLRELGAPSGPLMIPIEEAFSSVEVVKVLIEHQESISDPSIPFYASFMLEAVLVESVELMEHIKSKMDSFSPGYLRFIGGHVRDAATHGLLKSLRWLRESYSDVVVKVLTLHPELSCDVDTLEFMKKEFGLLRVRPCWPWMVDWCQDNGVQVEVSGGLSYLKELDEVGRKTACKLVERGYVTSNGYEEVFPSGGGTITVRLPGIEKDLIFRK